ncbi:PLP-dependent aminotransferase family protein [Actinomadura oligospora]|uniref:MocR-like pyridoxine biosynthesis transcription factor PdxR n=1 Tax=Actinomadura oligospora TaxID=111804 RepID=UPI00047BB879|nr:PLP-dependent aminotransferase family protein [Actinomadura oligospora]
MFDLPLTVDRERAEPLGAQLAGQLRAALRDGRLVAGERLPSGRTLAAALGVSRTVVTEAYGQLYAEGWLEGRHGSGTYVTEIVPAPRPTWDGPVPHERFVPEGVIDLRPGAAWIGGLDGPAWRRAWRLAAAAVPSARPDPHGRPALRAALAEHMRRSRGVSCTPDGVVVTRGVGNGLDLLAATVLRPGDRVGVEDPGWARARTVLDARGMTPVPCPVDEHGLVVDALPGDLRMVYTTPSHQYPLGGVLPVPRRQALLAWARRTGALVVEDDYDGEFRYDVAPLPALFDLDPEVVVHLGTTAKILTSDVGVGWLVARPELAEAVARRRIDLADRTAAVSQEAVRLLLESGDLDRHVRRMRAEYARRRAVVTEELAGLPLVGDTAGLHLVVSLPPGRAQPIAAEAVRHGVLLDVLEHHHAGPARFSGLVIGYGAVAGRTELRTACTLVRRLVTSRAEVN